MGKRARTAEYGIDFSGPAESAAGWAIPVTAAFRERLDILWTSWKDKGLRQGWTQGVPACFSFTVGDVFYDPPEVRAMAWGEALKILKRTVRVLEAKPDVEHGAGIIDGEVTFLYSEGDNLAPEAGRKIRTTQHRFVEFLRSGVLPMDLTGRRIEAHGSNKMPLRAVSAFPIKYCNAEGVVSERNVFAMMLRTNHGSVYLDAICRTSQAPKSFRADRILHLVDPETGEVFEGETVVPWLFALADRAATEQDALVTA